MKRHLSESEFLAHVNQIQKHQQNKNVQKAGA